jgi:hypothetical protein
MGDKDYISLINGPSPSPGSLPHEPMAIVVSNEHSEVFKISPEYANIHSTDASTTLPRQQYRKRLNMGCVM